MNFIQKSTCSYKIEFERFIGKSISIEPMLKYFGLDEEDMLQSLYNLDKQHGEVYTSPDDEPFNYYKSISESDPDIEEKLKKIMY